MYLNVHCCAIFRSDLDSWDTVDAKNGLTHLDWTPDTRDTKCVLKWVLVCIAVLHCTTLRFGFLRLSTIKKCPHTLKSEGAEKQLRKVNVGGGGWVFVWRPEQLSLQAEQSRALERSLSISPLSEVNNFIVFRKMCQFLCSSFFTSQTTILNIWV